MYLHRVAWSIVNEKELSVCGTSPNTVVSSWHKACDTADRNLNRNLTYFTYIRTLSRTLRKMVTLTKTAVWEDLHQRVHILQWHFLWGMLAEMAEDSAAEADVRDTGMKHLAKQTVSRTLEFFTSWCCVVIQTVVKCKYIVDKTNLFWSKYSSNIVSDALAATGAENCAPLSLPILIRAGNTHTSRDDTVGLQDVDHFTILLGKKCTVPLLIISDALRHICN